MILGINAQNHDASMALIDGKNIVWAAHAERYSRVKNDPLLNVKGEPLVNSWNDAQRWQMLNNVTVY